MTSETDPVARLAALCDSGTLRFVYVVGVARSNSTVVCRVLGQELDGAVYEPATPVAMHLRNHHARVILKAYDAARAGKPGSALVLLAIKDLSLFLDDETFAFVLKYAAHVVFTVRDPLTQYPSLVTQFKTEFGIRNRVDALVRWPLETCLFGYYMLTLGAGYVARAARRFGVQFSKALQLPIVGWNLTSWGNIVRQFDRAQETLGGDRITVLDAGLMRLMPDAATAALREIAQALKGGQGRTATPVELAGHSRMFPDSAWAGEARHSNAIKPLSSATAPRRPKDAFEEKLLGAFYPDFGHLFFSRSNRLLEAARREPQAGVAQLSHLIEAETAADSLERLLGSHVAAADNWQSEPRHAAE